MAVILFTLLVIVLTILYLYFTRNFNFWEKQNIKGPKPVVFFGNVKDGALKKTSYNELYKKIYEQFPNEKVVGIYQMTTPCLLIRDPEIVKKLLIKDYNSFITRGFKLSKEDVGTTLFQSDAVTWKALRSKYTPMFTTGKLKTMIPSIVDAAEKYLKYLNKQLESNDELKTHLSFKRYTIAAIAASSFNLDISPEDEKSHARLAKIDKAIYDLNIVNEVNMMYPWVLSTFKLSMFPQVVAEFYEELTSKMIADRKGVPSNKNDFLDILLKLKMNKIIDVNGSEDDKDITFEVTDKILSAQTFQYFAAAYETTATSLSLTCFNLATHPDVKDKLVKEIERVLAAHNNELTYESLGEMTYLDNVVAETLRMYPPLDPLQRMAEEDYYLPEVDLTIKKGQIILVSEAGIQNDEQYYPEPHKFNPERFDETQLTEGSTYLPFGTGPKYCIGKRLANLQSKVLLSKLLREYDIVPSPNTPIPLRFRPYTLLLTPENGLPLRFVPKKNR